MRSKLVAVAVAVAVAIGGTTVFVMSAGAAPKPPEPKVTICHRDNNEKQPYGPKAITVARSAVDGVGGNDHFGRHDGPLVTTLAEAQARKAAHDKWGDIIPPVPGVHNGLNWPAGASILANNCQLSGPPPTSTQPPPSSTRPPPSTTRPSPGKVTLCHRDNNPKQPYGPKPITVSVNGALNGHAGHTGPIATSVAVAEALKAQGIKWGDIIPPIPGLPNGLNWPAGQSLLANNCQVPGPPPTSTTQPPTSTTQPPSSTTQPPSSTTRPPSSTTRPPSSTTQPPSSTTQPPTSTTQPPRPTPPAPPPAAPAAPIPGRPRLTG